MMQQHADRIGPFALEEALSPEPDCRVFRAVHVQEKRVLAVKLLPRSVVAGDQALAEFSRQIAVLKTLQHPHIVCCYGGGKSQGQPYLAMELIQGESLSAAVRRLGPLPWETVVELGQQICAGLEFGHQRWLVHERLSSSKLILGEDGQVRIAGFGLSRFEGVREDDGDTDGLIEKACYLSPEQAAGKTPTLKADLYSLGCVLFELLTGHPPFMADSPEAIQELHLHALAPRVTSEIFDCPVWLDALVAQLLEKEPDRRPHFASAVAMALKETKDHMAAGTGIVQHSLSGSASVLKMGSAAGKARKMFGRRERKQRAAVPVYERVWFLVACLLLLLGFGAWVVWPAGEQKLYARAEALMKTGDRGQWTEARTKYLEPLLTRFPQGEHAAQAQRWLDQIDMEQAEARMSANARIGRDPTCEGERLYAAARAYEQFGDTVAAREQYQGMAEKLSLSGPDAPFIKLAKRQMSQIDSGEPAAADRAAWLQSKLDEADRLAEEGQTLEARKIWTSIESLYRSQRGAQKIVSQARARLAGEPSEVQPDDETMEAPVDGESEDQDSAATETSGEH